jgi:cyclase
MRDEVGIPVAGACGNPDHILEVLRDTNASAALAASIFHFGEYTVADVKDYLRIGGVHVRL